jgi:hypothetical protein
VDRKVCHFEFDSFATVACAVAVPTFDAMQIALTGHPPRLSPVRDTARNVAPGPPLGVGGAHLRSSSSVALESDTVVAFYTDGLVERRSESIEDRLQRLCDVIKAGSANMVARDIMRGLVGSVAPDGDIALVVLRKLNANSHVLR